MSIYLLNNFVLWIVFFQAILDFTYHDETELTNEEFPEKNSKERIAKIFSKLHVYALLREVFVR